MGYILHECFSLYTYQCHHNLCRTWYTSQLRLVGDHRAHHVYFSTFLSIHNCLSRFVWLFYMLFQAPDLFPASVAACVVAAATGSTTTEPQTLAPHRDSLHTDTEMVSAHFHSDPVHGNLHIAIKSSIPQNVNRL
jgi:hypothetical protein